MSPPMKSIDDSDLDYLLTGAASSEFCNGHGLAREAWGEAAQQDNGGLLAFGYLWRRFGPPVIGSDAHKGLCDYLLSTAEPEVFLWMHLSGSRLWLCTGYHVSEKLAAEAHQPLSDWLAAFQRWWQEQHPDEASSNPEELQCQLWRARERSEVYAAAVKAIGTWPERPHLTCWREAGGVVTRINRAIFNAMRELLRPVYIRDCPLNLFGRCDETSQLLPRCEPSRYAGYPMDLSVLDKRIAKQRKKSET